MGPFIYRTPFLHAESQMITAVLNLAYVNEDGGPMGGLVLVYNRT